MDGACHLGKTVHDMDGDENQASTLQVSVMSAGQITVSVFQLCILVPVA